MAFEPYRRGDALRRPSPNTNTCIDCKIPQGSDEIRSAFRRRQDYPYLSRTKPMCEARGCEPASVIDNLAALGRRS